MHTRTRSPCCLCGHPASASACSSAALFSAPPQGSRGAAGRDSAPHCPAAAPHPPPLCCQTSTSVRQPPPACVSPPRFPRRQHPYPPQLRRRPPPAESASPDTGRACEGLRRAEADCLAPSGSAGRGRILQTTGIRVRRWAGAAPSLVTTEADTATRRRRPSTSGADASGAKGLRFEQAARSSSCKERLQVGLSPDWADPPAGRRCAGSTPGARSRAGTCSPPLVLGDTQAGRRLAEA